ncbi:MAG: hypothetical protein JWN41_1462, partial [Thermoleophilia bacterium]|nr:hypothetical protein [Thermoleophilia bacterium]
WAVDWLLSSEHQVSEDQPATFLKVLDPAWLESAAVREVSDK